MTTEALCRIAVCAHGAGGGSTMDLVVPGGMDVGEVTPCIVDLALPNPRASGTDSSRQQWMLSRLDGSTLDESLSLHENGVQDGDLLVLTPCDSASTPTFADLSGYVVDASARMKRDAGWTRQLGLAAWLWSAGLGTAALVWPTHVAQEHRAIAAAVVAAATAVAAVTTDRIGADSSIVLSMSVTTMIFGAVAGFLMVPGGPAPPNFFLAAIICSAVATVLLRFTTCGTTSLTAITSWSLMIAVSAAGATIWPVSPAAVGSLLTVASLAMLAVAAKVSIVVAGLSPRVPTAEEQDEDDARLDASVGISRAQRGHEVLTGLLAGLAFAAAVGTALVASDNHEQTAWVRVAFAIAVFSVLTFRACRQRGAMRSATVLFAGLLCLTAGFISTVDSSPEHAAWMGLVAVALGAGALCLTRVDLASRLGPVTRRAFEAVEYLALVAVVPMACWMAGVFGLVRGLSLT